VRNHRPAPAPSASIFRALCVAALAVWTGCGGGGGDGAPAASVQPVDLEQDERIAWLLQPCPRGGPYLVDLADIERVLVHTLLTGTSDAMKAAKLELARSGKPGLAAARRVMEEYWDAPEWTDHVINALDVAIESEEPQAHELIVRALGHASVRVRILAVRGLQRRGLAQDYDLVRPLVEVAPPEYRAEVALLLHKLDAARAEELYLDWIAAGTYPGLWSAVAPRIGGSLQEATRERCGNLWEAQPDLALRIWLSAPPARGGDEAALARLRAWLHSEERSERDLAVRALAAAGLEEELRPTLAEDSSEGLRLLAVRAIEAAPDRPALRALLQLAASDAHPDVRNASWRALARRGEAAATDRALALLTDGVFEEIGPALEVLAERWDEQPQLAEAAFDKLSARLAPEKQRTVAEGSLLVRSIGRIPSVRAASWMYELASHSEGEVGGMRSRRWVLLFAGNGGKTAQQWLFERLKEVRDPLFRVDLLEAASAAGGELARDRLLEVVDEGGDELEVLYAADRAARIGPASEVAGRVKRAYLRLESARGRRAMECVLWRWWPGPE
jgi:HEAT repeat protein